MIQDTPPWRPKPADTLCVNGHRCHVIDRGQGQPIVILHGLGSMAREIAWPLRSLRRDYRVIGADLSLGMLAANTSGAPVVQADCSGLPFPDGAFDGLLCGLPAGCPTGQSISIAATYGGKNANASVTTAP